MPASRVVTLRNLVITKGILVSGASRVNLENCIIENCRDHGVLVSDKARVHISNCQVRATGFRVGSEGDTAVDDPPTPGIGIEFGKKTKGLISGTSVTNSFGPGFKSSTQILKTLFKQFDNNRGHE